MAFILDKLFSALPALVFLCHSANSLKHKRHIATVLKFCICFVLSMILKMIFRANRRAKSFEFNSWSFGIFTDITDRLKGSYSFPSSHAIFFGMYFLMYPNPITFAMLVLGAFYRVYYEHHTIYEVLLGALLGLAFEACCLLVLGSELDELIRRWG